MNRLARTLAAAACLSIAFAAAAAAEESTSYQNLLTPLLSSGTTVIDQPIAYPAGTPKVTGAIVTFLALWVLASDDGLSGWWESSTR